ncbi:deoxycytidylate deaminase, partial [Cronobacter muytjensii]
MKEQKFVSELFLENGQFILVGLTGRTGSGCTTTANILEDKKPIFPDVDKLTGFYEGLDIERYQIVKSFTEKHWDNFYSIKVSDLISVYLLMLDPYQITNFISLSSEKNVDKSIIQT